MIAIPIHQSRVAPVLDWCSTILLIPENAGKSWHDAERLSIETNIFELLRLLHDKDVSPIICGALSPRALSYGQHLGLEFIYGISGAIGEVIDAYLAGKLDQPRFRLPGCGWACQPQPSTGPSPYPHGSEQGGIAMPGNQGKGGLRGSQQGKGRGRGCAMRGRGGAVGGTNLDAVCVCPQCGREAPHSRGVPCTQMACRECGAPLVRKSPTTGSSM
jgi:predicted Fe-Mo cluster-binding NifX family protein